MKGDWRNYDIIVPGSFDQQKRLRIMENFWFCADGQGYVKVVRGQRGRVTDSPDSDLKVKKLVDKITKLFKVS